MVIIEGGDAACAAAHAGLAFELAALGRTELGAAFCVGAAGAAAAIDAEIGAADVEHGVARRANRGHFGDMRRLDGGVSGRAGETR